MNNRYSFENTRKNLNELAEDKSLEEHGQRLQGYVVDIENIEREADQEAASKKAEELREKLNQWVAAYVDSDLRDFTLKDLKDVNKFNKQSIHLFKEIYQAIFDLQIALSWHYPTDDMSIMADTLNDVLKEDRVPLPDGTWVTKQQLHAYYTISYNGWEYESAGYHKHKNTRVPRNFANKILNPIELEYIKQTLGKETMDFDDCLPNRMTFIDAMRGIVTRRSQQAPDRGRMDDIFDTSGMFNKYLTNLYSMRPGLARTAAYIGVALGFVGLIALIANGGLFFHVVGLPLALLYGGGGLAGLYSLAKYWNSRDSWTEKLLSLNFDFSMALMCGLVVTSLLSLVLVAVTGFLVAHAVIPAAAAATVMGVFAVVKPFIPLILSGLGVLSDLLEVSPLQRINMTIFTLPMIVVSKVTSLTAVALKAVTPSLLHRGIEKLWNLLAGAVNYYIVDPFMDWIEQGAQESHATIRAELLSDKLKASKEELTERDWPEVERNLSDHLSNREGRNTRYIQAFLSELKKGVIKEQVPANENISHHRGHRFFRSIMAVPQPPVGRGREYSEEINSQASRSGLSPRNG